jgi:hypothetical protein
LTANLDPHTAHVQFRYEDLGGGCVGRVYYWASPTGERTAISDADFRRQHPEFTDGEWARLFRQAFERGEDVFVRELRHSFEQQGFDVSSEPVRRVLAIGRTFGPSASE